MAEHLDDALPADHLLDVAVDRTEILLPLGEVLLGNLPERGGHAEHQEGHDDGDQGERQAEDDHTDEGRDNGDDGLEQVGDAVADDLPEGVHIVGIDRHNVAVRMRVKVAEREFLHTAEEVLAESQHRPLPHRDHYEVLRVAGDDAGEQDGAQFDERDRERMVVRGHRGNVVVDERPREKRRRKRGDRRNNDAEQREADMHLVMAEDITEEPEDCLGVLEVLQGGSAAVLAAASPHTESWRTHSLPSFFCDSSKSPSPPDDCIS